MGEIAGVAQIGAGEVGAIEIGAAATYTDILPSLDRHIPAFTALVRRIGREQAVPPEAHDLIEAFVDKLPAGSIGDVLKAFALLERHRAAA